MKKYPKKYPRYLKILPEAYAGVGLLTDEKRQKKFLHPLEVQEIFYAADDQDRFKVLGLWFDRNEIEFINEKDYPEICL